MISSFYSDDTFIREVLKLFWKIDVFNNKLKHLLEADSERCTLFCTLCLASDTLAVLVMP